MVTTNERRIREQPGEPGASPLVEQSMNRAEFCNQTPFDKKYSVMGSSTMHMGPQQNQTKKKIINNSKSVNLAEML